MKVHFKKATLTSGHFNILFVPTVAYGKHDSERWKYRHGDNLRVAVLKRQPHECSCGADMRDNRKKPCWYCVLRPKKSK